MKTRLLCSLLAGLALAGFCLRSIAEDHTPSLLVAARKATSEYPSRAQDAIKTLRAAGSDGLNALSAVYSNAITEHLSPNPFQLATTPDAQWERIRLAFDSVGQQRDCYASHLFWFTDLEQAKAAARASGKPILSLRLLGNLNEEYSCANSRFFRTTLYPNTEVSQYLRDHFILHWQSVRPVPRITIDMGDGRKIERTITGNSIHYVLDADGNPIDALPGLYSAKQFLTDLDRAATAAQQSAKLSGSERIAFLRNYHAAQLADIEQQWSRDLDRSGQTGVELNLAKLDSATTEPVWQKIALLHYDDARLDPAAYQFATSKQTPPTIEEAMRRTMCKGIVETPMIKAVRNLEHSVAGDTVHNEYEMHSRIHEWFANGNAPQNLKALNKKVYAELFLTPDSDPWLGLAPADVYSALDHDGLVQNVPSH